MTKPTHIPESGIGAIVISKHGKDVRVEVILKDETLWLTQAQIAEVFEVDESTVHGQIENIYRDEELTTAATMAEMQIARVNNQSSGNGKVAYYNLDVVIALSLRLKSQKAKAFCSWATRILCEYSIKGFALDDERIKNPEYFLGKEYFEDMLERIAEIRLSDRCFYQKLTDIYQECSIDYDRDSVVTQAFFKRVINVLDWAIARQTDAETIPNRADHKTEEGALNRLVSMYLDYAEDQARRQIPLTMKDWAARLEAILQFDKEELLTDPDNKVSEAIGLALAVEDYQLDRQIHAARNHSKHGKINEH